MSVTEYKRRSKKVYVLMGALTVMVPAIAGCAVLGSICHCLWEQNEALEQKQRAINCKTGYLLTQDVLCGQKIEAQMLQEVTVYSEKQQVIAAVDAEKLIGRSAKDDFKKGSVISENCVYEEEVYHTDMRTKTYSFMNINEGIQNGDYVDIRITYPNGEDYIIAKHKKVLSVSAKTESDEEQPYIQKDSIRMNVTEEELLRITSAYVDTVYYTGAEIYAIAYLDQFQKPASVNYPVNPDVYELLGWNPNAVQYQAAEAESQNRMVLEQHLTQFLADDAKASVQRRMEQELIED